MNFKDTSAPSIYEYLSVNLDFTPNDTKFIPYSSKSIVIGTSI